MMYSKIHSFVNSELGKSIQKKYELLKSQEVARDSIIEKLIQEFKMSEEFFEAWLDQE
jgi:hypothetical protein